MNIVDASSPKGFICETYPNTTPQALAHSVGKFRRDVIGLMTEGPEDFYQRAAQIEGASGSLIHVVRVTNHEGQVKDTVSYALAPSKVVPDQAHEMVADANDDSTRQAHRIEVQEMFVASSHRKEGIARLMLNKLAFNNCYGAKRAPVEMAVGSWLDDTPEFRAALQSAGFVEDEDTGLMTIRLPGDFEQIGSKDEYDKATKEMPFGWSGVLDASVGRRGPSFLELYRNGDMLARMTEVDMPAGVAVELGGEPEGASQLLIPIDETSPTLDDLYRRVLLQILNNPEFPGHVG